MEGVHKLTHLLMHFISASLYFYIYVNENAPTFVILEGTYNMIFFCLLRFLVDSPMHVRRGHGHFSPLHQFDPSPMHVRRGSSRTT